MMLKINILVATVLKILSHLKKIYITLHYNLPIFRIVYARNEVQTNLWIDVKNLRHSLWILRQASLRESDLRYINCED